MPCGRSGCYCVLPLGKKTAESIARRRSDEQADVPADGVGSDGGDVRAAVAWSGAGGAREGEDYRRQVHDRARDVGLEPDQDRDRCRRPRHRRSLLGLGRQRSRPQQAPAHRHRRRPAQRRQALYEDADGERRRGRDRGRHRDRRERHRDRAVGSRRAPPRNALLQSARRPLPRSHPLLSDDAGGRQAGGSAGVARAGARGQGREVRLDRLQIPG